MDYTYYLFATFVFLLVCAVLYLNSRLKRSRTEEKKAPVKPPELEDSSELLMAQYRRLESAMRNLDEELQEARGEIRHQREEASSMLESMEQLYNDMRDEMQQRNKEKAKTPVLESRLATTTQRKKPGPKRKTTSDRVGELYRAGLNAEKIAKELNVSRGEVDLVLGLYKKRGI
jgi:DNA anti-recombination protein RmuC